MTPFKPYPLNRDDDSVEVAFDTPDGNQVIVGRVRILRRYREAPRLVTNYGGRMVEGETPDDHAHQVQALRATANALQMMADEADVFAGHLAHKRAHPDGVA